MRMIIRMMNLRHLRHQVATSLSQPTPLTSPAFGNWSLEENLTLLAGEYALKLKRSCFQAYLQDSERSVVAEVRATWQLLEFYRRKITTVQKLLALLLGNLRASDNSNSTGSSEPGLITVHETNNIKKILALCQQESQVCKQMIHVSNSRFDGSLCWTHPWFPWYTFGYRPLRAAGQAAEAVRQQRQAQAIWPAQIQQTKFEAEFDLEAWNLMEAAAVPQVILWTLCLASGPLRKLLVFLDQYWDQLLTQQFLDNYNKSNSSS